MNRNEIRDESLDIFIEQIKHEVYYKEFKHVIKLEKKVKKGSELNHCRTFYDFTEAKVGSEEKTCH